MRSWMIYECCPLTVPLCVSTHAKYFWREYGISLSNFFLRIVADVQAIFNGYFANDAVGIWAVRPHGGT